MNIPSSLYKYTTFENAYLTIENQKFKWSSIFDFNDPFESRFYINERDKLNAIRETAISISLTSKFFDSTELNDFLRNFKNINPGIHKTIMNAKKRIDEIITQHAENPTEKYLLKLEKEIKHWVNESFILDLALSSTKGLAEKTHHSFATHFGVLCLSKTKNNPLMWSHYTNNHTGIMFELDSSIMKKLPQLHNTIREVKYTETYPEITYELIKGMNKKMFPKESKKLFETIASTKQKIWEYENEVRSIISLKNNNRLLTLPKECFKSITLGCAMTDNNKNEAIRNIQKNLPNTKIFKNEISRSSYKMEYIEI
ncbi:DUF2971 domain-containing protein [Salmonella enterica subsp. enterica]|nr:DUF2971 domain-containing protein [Salmonella enterica subsp. enterica]EAW9774294.1 DUF2971 domain-containing protein [Salmonella enterica]